ncbi:MAG: hypothetical protein F6K23_13920 [Okeania sp. SIO2C9]|uniref:hypothetical protein n=1 Tax=Okeania sp. SIO2C9 TaxID=2607791 RepID=UPI0013BF2445|nr:hypothetical protein [Okeania sp. SIO2C9]NEQ74040.1 hypothetical protein [Okeania sp. SIO2C9]
MVNQKQPILNNDEVKQLFIKGVNIFLAGSAITLVFGFMIWFVHGTIMVSDLSEKIVAKGWGALIALMAVFLSFIVPSIVTLFGFAVMALLVWWLSRVFSQYEEFQPTALIVYQLVAPVGMIAALILASPVLISYAVIRLFNGSGQALISEVKEASSILLPLESDNKFMSGTPAVETQYLTREKLMSETQIKTQYLEGEK